MRSLILINTVLVILVCGDPAPFCKLQLCHNIISNGTSMVDVISYNEQKHIILDNKSWINPNTNKSYAYHSVTFQNNKFINLTYIFPPSNLTMMNLAFNDIYSLGDNVFKNLQRMKTLILSNNDLENLHPDAFKGLYMAGELYPLESLNELRLDHNKLHSLDKDLFEHTTHIEILDLSSNPLDVIDDHTTLAIDTLVILKELYLQYTGIKTLPENLLHTPKYLQILDLSGNPIQKFPDTLKQAQNLKNLYMNNTGFVNLTHENGFPELPNLRVLHLCRNEYLSHLMEHSLSGLSGLEDLRICDNIDLTVIDPMALAKPINNSGGSVLPPIKKLYIGNNKLAYIDGEIIARWDGLSELDIRHNAWVCDCENQWLIDNLMPLYLKIDPDMAKEVMCDAPIEMEKYSFFHLYTHKTTMRCLDAFGAHPENDAAILVGVLAGVLIAIPLILFLVMAYQRRWISICGFCDDSPAAYSRRYYKANSADENF